MATTSPSGASCGTLPPRWSEGKLAAGRLRRLLLEVLLDRVPEEAEGFLLGAAGDCDGGVGDGGGAVEAFFLDEIDFDAHRRSAPGPAVCGSRHARTLTAATGSVKARARRVGSRQD